MYRHSLLRLLTVIGLLLLLCRCDGTGQGGGLSSPEVHSTPLEQQAINNLLGLYRTAIMQEDIDRLQELLQAETPSSLPGVPRQEGGTLSPPAEFLASMTVVFARSAVLDLQITQVETTAGAEPLRVAFQETLSLEAFNRDDASVREQRTQSQRTILELRRDATVGLVTLRIAAVRHEGPRVEVATPGQVQADMLARVLVTEVTGTATIVSGTIEVPETGVVQTLQVTDGVLHGAFSAPAQPRPQPLVVRLTGSNGEQAVVLHRYRVRMPGEGVVQRITQTGRARFFALALAPDGTVWAGGDEPGLRPPEGGGTLYRVLPGSTAARFVGDLFANPAGRVQDLAFDQLGRLHAVASALDGDEELCDENGTFCVASGTFVFDLPVDPGLVCQTVNTFGPGYPFQVQNLQTGETLPSPSTRAIMAGAGDIWLHGSDGGVARVADGFRNGQCPDDAVEVRYAPILRREDSGLLSNTVPAMVASPDGTLWFGTALGLTRWRDGQFTPVLFQRDFTLPDARAIATLEALFREVAEAIFNARPLSTVAINGLSLVDLFGRALVKEDLIFSTLDDAQGQLWVGTLGGGLRRIDTRAEVPQDTLHLTRQDGLISNIAFALAAGSDQTIWIATEEGVSRLSVAGETVSITNFSPLDGLAQPVRDVAVDGQGVVWLATDGGLFRIIPQGGTVRGTVRDQAGLPVAGADVTIQMLFRRGTDNVVVILGTPFRTVTDADGRFVLTNLPPGPLRLRFDGRLAARGPFATAQRNVTVTIAGEQTLAPVTLSR